MNKAETIQAIQRTHDQLLAAIAQVPTDMLTQPGVTGQWSVKDILAHITFWEQIMLARHRRAILNEPVQIDDIPVGETVQQTIDRLNDENYHRNKDRSLSDVRLDFDRSFQQVVASAESLSDADYESTSDIAKALKRPLSDDFASDSFDHYPEHTETILKWAHNILNKTGGEVFDA